MKPAACIVLLVWTILLVEPGFANYAKKVESSDCSKKYKPVESSCSTTKCSKPGETEIPSDSEEDNDCTSNRCNPLMSCPTGNFYLSGHPQVTIAPLIWIKEKKIAVNDNRLSEKLSECWHPPEII